MTAPVAAGANRVDKKAAELANGCTEHNDVELGIPDGYIDRSDWFEEMSKTHTQKRCSKCGLWCVWIPKAKRSKAKVKR